MNAHAARYLTSAQYEKLAVYAVRRSVYVMRGRDGKVMVSLNGFRRIPLADALKKIAA